MKGLKLRTPPELQIQASMEALGASVQAPPQYWRSQPSGNRGLFGEASSGQR